jgi:Na+-translocating ferredoxin:NAD+ oxidoreductase RnfD subunit
MSDPATTTADSPAPVTDDPTLSSVVCPLPPEATPPGLLQAAGGTIPRARVPTGLLTHGGITIGQFFGTQMIGLAFPLAAGVLFYGWRAIVATAIVVGTATVAAIIWRRAGWRGAHLRYPHVAWMALLLALMLPAHLAADAYSLNKQLVSPWPLLPAAGICLVILLWLLGGVGSWRMHPVLVAYLLLLVVGRAMFVPHAVLQRSHV